MNVNVGVTDKCMDMFVFLSLKRRPSTDKKPNLEIAFDAIKSFSVEYNLTMFWNAHGT